MEGIAASSYRPRQVLFFGSLITSEDCHQNPACSEAANNFQLNLLRGLLDHGVERIVAFTMYPVASFPRSGCLLVGRRIQYLCDGRLSLITVPFSNIGVFKWISMAFSFPVQVLSQTHNYDFNPDVVLVYNPMVAYSLSALRASWRFQIPSALIVADLPTPGKSASFFRRIDARLQRWLLGRFSGLIALSSYIVSEFGGSQPTLRVEGGVDESLLLPHSGTLTELGRSARKSIMFSGSLGDYSGVRLLLDAFAMLDGDEYELWITGRGDIQKEIELAAQMDQRIRCFGFVDRNIYLSLLSRATVLVNPRLSSLPVNRYNFPSKLMDYLASGRPVITTATSGLEEEYGDKVFLLREEATEALVRLIEDVCSRDPAELDAIGQRARQYVLQHKTWDVQSRRVYDFLCGLAASRRGGKGVTA